MQQLLTVGRGQRGWVVRDDQGRQVVQNLHGGAESRLPWGHLASAEIRGPFLLLFTNAIVHFIVPFSAFANDVDRNAALEMVRRRELLPPV